MTANEMVETMKASRLRYFGFRVIDGDHPVGSNMEISHVWDIYGRTDEELNGSSTIGICEDCDLDDVETVAQSINAALDMSTHYAGITYLVGGQYREYGEDDGEWIISDGSLMEPRGAVVLAAI